MRRFTVQRCDEGGTLIDGPDHTWDVLDRVTGDVVLNVDTRAEARREALNYEREVALATLVQGTT